MPFIAWAWVDFMDGIRIILWRKGDCDTSPRTRRQFGQDCPDNINDCEQVRRWTLGWPKDVEILAET